MIRFLKFVLITFPGFLCDLALLIVLTRFLGVNYLLATAISFILANTLNYILSRTFIFVGTTRPVHTGYIYFLSIAAIGLGSVTFSMWVLVGLLHFNYILSRISIALVEGVWNYLMNLYVNFKVAGS